MASSSFNVWGLASGIDTESIIKALMLTAKAPITRYQNQQLEITWKQEIWNSIKERLKTLQEVASNLADKNSIVTKKGVSSNESVLTVSTTGSAPLGTYVFNVLDIARAHTVTSNSYNSKSEKITFSNGNITINGKTINVGTQASLLDIAQAINTDADISAKVKASIVNTGSGYRLAITSLIGSIDSIDFSGNNDALITLGILKDDGTVKYPNSSGEAKTQLATDLQFTLSGMTGTIIRQSNKVTDLFEGVILNINSTGTSVVTINYDTSQAISNIERFVNVYNETISYIRTKLTEEREEGIAFLSEAEKEKMTYYEIQQHNEKLKVGLLRNDSTLREIEEQLRSIISGVVHASDGTPLSPNIRSLADIGISIGKVGYVSMEDILSGKLTIDYETLNGALTENPEVVAELFSKSYTFIQDEIPEGNIDGMSTTFKLKHVPVSYDIRPMVYADGVLLTQVFGNTTPGLGQFKIDYTTGTLTLGQAPANSLKISYGYRVTTESTAGIAVRLNNILKEYTEEVTGVIPYTINNLTTEYKELNELISDTSLRLSLYEESLIAKFTALESAIASLQSQSNFLSSYITGLQKQGGK
ncbi:MAG: flagellar filament capping protein FliD [bacterium]